MSAAQEAFARTRLLEGALPEMIRRQAGEAGLTVLGRNERLAYDSAENAIQRESTGIIGFSQMQAKNEIPSSHPSGQLSATP